MQCMHSRRAFIAPVKPFGRINVRVPLAILRIPAVRRDGAGHHVRGAANLDAPSHDPHTRSQVGMQTETLLQPKSEHMALKALKVAVLVPVLFSVMWTDPAHAARKSRKSAAAQIVELVTAEEPKSPLEQLQAQINSFIHKITDKISHKSDKQAAAAAAAAAADNGFLAQVPSKISAGLQQLQQPGARKVLAATAAVLVVALLLRSAQGSSSARSAASDGDSSSGTSGTVKVTIPADAANSAGAAAPVFATIAGNGTGSNLKVSVTIPGAAAPSAAAATQQQQQKEAARSTAEADKLLKTIRDSEDRIKATAAATKREVKASAAAASAAVDKAKAAADHATSRLTSRSASPSNPEPPKVVKPNITRSPASTPATSQLAGSSPATSQLPGFGSSSSSSRPSSPPPIPNVPDKGAATPALTVLGAGAILFDLMMPLGRLAVAGARSAAGLPSNVTVESNTAVRSSSSSSSSDGSSAARTSGASSRPSTPPPKPKPAPAAPAAPPAPPKPPSQSKLAKALAAAAAAESAIVPRSVPTELPPVTLEELEAALRASGKMT